MAFFVHKSNENVCRCSFVLEFGCFWNDGKMAKELVAYEYIQQKLNISHALQTRAREGQSVSKPGRSLDCARNVSLLFQFNDGLCEEEKLG
ncbi:hypothetical protein C3K47_10560 [Solitalea longa]|uniref:Uncharacterized protein n=1 Tax=Solitalea longa TaxID=2079460 RepID=A0A2S5A2J2_9SPHI|nr:hypothetical protein C3K47_10560 [Solitalea longa]